MLLRLSDFIAARVRGLMSQMPKLDARSGAPTTPRQQERCAGGPLGCELERMDDSTQVSGMLD
jgi:hypothetical protein